MRGRAAKITAGIILVLSVILSVYIMTNHLGLIDGLDFGEGAYYYADIPEFDRYMNPDTYKSPVSMWVIIVLFLIWGAAMYKLLLWTDRKWK
ncbi:MAG: hypothetical protein IJG65_05535 [Synergistaceae bacterium]|nr:hypothetical protein [Synergistaceae bacterium]